MAVRGPISGSELMPAIQGDQLVFLTRTQVAAFLALNKPGVGMRPFGIPGPLSGAERFNAIQGDQSIIFTAADINTYLAATGPIPPVPYVRQAGPITGSERLIGDQTGTAIGFSSAEASTIAVTVGAVAPPLGPPAPPTPTAAVLPTPTTAGAAYVTVNSLSRLMSGFSGALAYVATGTGTTGGQDVGAGKTDLAIADLPQAVTPLYGLYDQTGNNVVPIQDTLANRPMIRAETAMSAGRLVASFAGHANLTGRRSFLQSTSTAISLTANSRTEILVVDPTTSIQNAVLTEHATAGGAADRDLYASPGSNGVIEAAQSASPFYLASVPQVIVLVETPSGANLWINGVKSALFGTGDGQTLTRFALGAQISSSGFNANMRLAAYAALNKPVSDADVTAITAALKGRFGIATDYAVNLTHIGDSIVETVQDTDTLGLKQYMLPNLNRRTKYWNLGIAGKTMASMYADRAKYEANLVAAGLQNIALLDAGINDIGLNGTSAAALYTIATNYITALRGFGYTKVGLTTLLPQSSTNYATGGAGLTNDQINAIRLTYNALVTGNAAGADFIVDRASESHCVYPVTDTTRFPDLLHPSTLQYVSLAPIYVAALNGVIQ